MRARILRSLGTVALTAVASLAASRAAAQALGPQRQFLAIEPYYEYTRFDRGGNGGTSGTTSTTTTLNGYGGRLWINGAPFHFPLNSSIALFMTYAPSKSDFGASVLHYGGEIDQFLVRRPFGGVIDPFLTVGVGGYRLGIDGVDGEEGGSTTHLALSPGGGIRIPLPNRFEIRGDVRDLILFGQQDNAVGSSTGTTKTTHNLVIQGGLGITF